MRFLYGFLIALLSTLHHGVFAHAAEPANSLIYLSERVLDMRYDVSKIRRDDRFIPITRVDWIDEIAEADAHLHPKVIHIEDRRTQIGIRSKAADRLETKYKEAEGIPERYLLDGYLVRWMQSSASKKSGDIIYFPQEDPHSFNVACGYISSEEWPLMCLMIVSYPPDPLLRIAVRLYNIERPFNDFRAIAHKARELVRRLDVTEEVENGTWAQRPHVDPKGPLPDMFRCREHLM